MMTFLSKASRGCCTVLLLLPLVAACQPTVKLEAPDKPIEINLNVKIEQEVRVSIARDVDKAIAADPSLF